MHTIQWWAKACRRIRQAYVSFWRWNAKLDETNLRLLDFSWWVGTRRSLCEDKSLNKFCIIYSSSQLANDFDILAKITDWKTDFVSLFQNYLQIYIGVFRRVDNLENCINSQGCQLWCMLRDNLRIQRSGGTLDETLSVVHFDGSRHLSEDFHTLCCCSLECIWDGRWVDSSSQQFFSSLQQRSRNNNYGSSAISSLDILRPGQLYQLKCFVKLALCNCILDIFQQTMILANRNALFTILAAGCITFICFKIVAPSLVMVTSPLEAWI